MHIVCEYCYIYTNNKEEYPAHTHTHTSKSQKFGVYTFCSILAHHTIFFSHFSMQIAFLFQFIYENWIKNFVKVHHKTCSSYSNLNFFFHSRNKIYTTLKIYYTVNKTYKQIYKDKNTRRIMHLKRLFYYIITFEMS